MKKTALIAAGIGLVIALASPDARALTTTFGANAAQPSDVTSGGRVRVRMASRTVGRLSS